MLNFEQFGQNIQDRPSVGKSLGLVDYEFPTIDAVFLAANFKRTNASKSIQQAVPPEKLIEKSGWFNRLLKTFGS
jgi:hypothetical protein